MVDNISVMGRFDGENDENQVFDVRENFYGIWDPPELSERQTQMPI